MKYDDLPARWKSKLTAYIHQKTDGERNKLSAFDFRYHVKIDFEDKSSAFFRYAFYVLDEGAREVAIFTEHCGYHIFPLGGTKLELFASRWTDVGTD